MWAENVFCILLRQGTTNSISLRPNQHYGWPPKGRAGFRGTRRAGFGSVIGCPHLPSSPAPTLTSVPLSPPLHTYKSPQSFLVSHRPGCSTSQQCRLLSLAGSSLVSICLHHECRKAFESCKLLRKAVLVTGKRRK